MSSKEKVLWSLPHPSNRTESQKPCGSAMNQVKAEDCAGKSLGANDQQTGGCFSTASYLTAAKSQWVSWTVMRGAGQRPAHVLFDKDFTQ